MRELRYVNIFAVSLVNQRTQVGDNVTFTCVDDLDFNNYTWQYNGVTITDEPGHISGANTSVLMIIDVSPTEWGTYRCIATSSNLSTTVFADGILRGK